MGMFCNGKVQFTSIYANLAKKILNRLEEKPGETIAYQELAKEMKIGARNFYNYLNELSVKCHELSLPLISAAVTEEEGKPYPEFAQMAVALGYSAQEQAEQKEAVFRQDWGELKRRMRIGEEKAEEAMPNI